MKLYWSSTSPFARKVLVVGHELGLPPIEKLTVVTSPLAPHPGLSSENPLVKIPTLVDGDLCLYDSHVICDYLCAKVPGNKILPAGGNARWKVLRTEALADGMLDAGILLRYEEIYREPSEQSPKWKAGQADKVIRALDWLEKNPAEYQDEFHLGSISLAAALGWLEFRSPIPNLRSGRATLFGWYDAVLKRPSMVETTPSA